MIEFNSAKMRLLILRITRILVILSIIYTALASFDAELYLQIILCILVVTAGVNDYIRQKSLKNHKSIWYHLSFILSNVIVSYLSYKIKCSGLVIYNIILIIDLLLFNEKAPVFLIIINFIAFCIPDMLNTNPSDNLSIEKIFLNYISIFTIVYIIKSITIDKIKTDKLNIELRNANSKLKEYSAKLEELTISKERTRIAQELHDSIGHSLIALSMNLEYAENIIKSKPEKAEEVIKKSHSISKNCIEKLREVVNVLKEDHKIKNLREGINELFLNFQDNEKYKFNLKMDDDIESESPKIKSCIYKTVMECITNGIKHGNAGLFDVEINKAENNILLKVSDDGLGCESIKKSNGIIGIEKRISELGGSMELYSGNNVGFTIDVVIPIGG